MGSGSETLRRDLVVDQEGLDSCHWVDFGLFHASTNANSTGYVSTFGFILMDGSVFEENRRLKLVIW